MLAEIAGISSRHGRIWATHELQSWLFDFPATTCQRNRDFCSEKKFNSSAWRSNLLQTAGQSDWHCFPLAAALLLLCWHCCQLPRRVCYFRTNTQLSSTSNWPSSITFPSFISSTTFNTFTAFSQILHQPQSISNTVITISWWPRSLLLVMTKMAIMWFKTSP